MKTYSRQPETKSDTAQPKASRQAPAHDILQAYKDKIAQRQEIDEDELLQGKFEIAQRKEIDEDELLQGKFETAQPSTENLTGMPDNLKSGIESLSGYSMDDVRVHYNSSKPAQLQALAYAQGADIHIAPGQEQHLPHEAWHVVQQKQGRVQPTTQLQGVNVNDNEGLEKEADVMGGKAVFNENVKSNRNLKTSDIINMNNIQRKIIARVRTVQSDSHRIIDEVRLEGRAPTDVPGSTQGDHTVAETLINESVKQEVIGMPRKIALNNLIVLSQLTLSDIDYSYISEKYGQYWEGFDTMDGEDKNKLLEEFIQEYIERANKRPGTAYLRSQEMTIGGGGERQSIGFIRSIADRIKAHEAISEHELYEVGANLVYLVDFKFTIDNEERYLNLVIRAIRHACLSVLYGLPLSEIKYVIEIFLAGLGQRDSIPIKNMIPYYNLIINDLKLD
ncbi:eCIS core domain-containing protein [Dysgonomonas termitidis]|uniref:DUF4157 domain-containing protein n=1 Tax=Dysgonomonas termitidis TaxID=1516126 RepID=A0ABV9KUM7_9BACT